MIYLPDGDNIVIVAAKGGHPENPSWLYNLRAHPDTEIQIGSRRIKVRAREADAEERQRGDLSILEVLHQGLDGVDGDGEAGW